MLTQVSREILQHARQLSGRRCVSGPADGQRTRDEPEEILLRFILFRKGKVVMILCGLSFDDACRRHGFEPEKLRRTHSVEQTP